LTGNEENKTQEEKADDAAPAEEDRED